MPVTAREPFIAKERSAAGCIACCADTPYAIRRQSEAELPAIPLARVHFTCIVCDMASLSIYCVRNCCAGAPFTILPHSGAILYLTHGRNVYFYHLDVPPSCLLYTRSMHGFWKLALYAFSWTWLHCCCTTTSIAEKVLSTRYYHTGGLSNV